MPPAPALLTFAEHGEGIGDAATVLRANAVAAGLEASVPTCPGWTVRDLVVHQGVVWRWASDVVGRVEPVRPEGDVVAEAAASPDLLDWLDDGLVEVLNVLAGAPEDLQVFFFLKDAPSSRLAWARRQCHEVTVHAVDAMAARLGHPPAAAQTWIRPTLAADGIDELLTGFVPRRTSRVRSTEPYRVAVRPSDVEQTWTMQISEDPVITTRGHAGRDDAGDAEAPADVVLTGTAAQLYLALWNRGPAEPDAGLQVTGRPDWLRTWHDQMQVRWS